jgi:hypothetical protein
VPKPSNRRDDLLPSGGEGVLEDENDGVATEKHFVDVAVLVDRLGFLLTLPGFRQLRPHLLDSFQNEVAVPVESLDPAEELLVVPAVDEDLGVVLDRVGENLQRTGVKLFLLLGLHLLWSHVGLTCCCHVFFFGSLSISVIGFQTNFRKSKYRKQ